jgi:hypothetical protein
LQKVIDEELDRLRAKDRSRARVQRAINQWRRPFYRAWSASAASAARPIS